MTEEKIDPNVKMLNKLEEEEWNKPTVSSTLSKLMSTIASLAVGSMVLQELSKSMKDGVWNKPKKKKEKPLWPTKSYRY